MKIGFVTLAVVTLFSIAIAAQTNTPGDQARDANFSETAKLILTAQRDPKYLRWKPDLVSFYSDARRLYHNAAVVRSMCASSKPADPQSCEAALMSESVVAADALAVGGLELPAQLRPDEDVDTIRPQIRQWYLSGFERDRTQLAGHGTTGARFQPEIRRADLFREKAELSAASGDWIGGLIALRHSQLIMENACVEALYHRSP